MRLPLLPSPASSPQLTLPSNTTQSSCTHGSCYIAYTNYVRIINPATNHCLTAHHPNANSTYNFQPCDPNPSTYAQFWEANQYVMYYPTIEPGARVVFEGVSLDVIQPGGMDGFLALGLTRSDNRTVSVSTFGYTQMGLSANLVEA